MSQWEWGLGVILAGTLLTGCGSGGPPPVAIDPPSAPVSYAVVVRDGVTAAPVAGVETPGGVTNADGYAVWAVVPGAPLVFTVSVPGYTAAEVQAAPVTDTQQDVWLTPTTRAPWPGRLALGPSSRCFVDGTGACQLPVLAHFGEAFSAYTRRPEAVRAQLAVIKAAGFQGIRTWDTLGYYDSVWRGREVMPWEFVNRSGQRIPATPGYYDQLEAFIRDVQAAGLVLHHSRGDLNGQPVERVVAHAERVAAIYDRIGWDMVALAESNNEDFQNGAFGVEGLRAIAAPFAQRGALTALSAPPGTSEEAAAVRAYSAAVFYVHGSRTGGHTDILRHIFSLAREAAAGTPRLGWQGEPAGPGDGVTVGQVNDPEALALMAAQSVISRQAWTYMSSHGVFWNGPIDSQPGFRAVPRMVAAIAAFAPDVMRWALTHRSAPDAVLTAVRPATNEARIDQAVAPDGRVVATVYDPTGAVTVRTVGPALACDVLGVAEDETLTRHPVTLDAGATVLLSYRVGRVLRCTPSGS